MAKWAAHLSFSTVAELLQDVLPVDTGLHQETVRQHVMATADRLEAEIGLEQFVYDGGCQRDIESSPERGPPITVGLDGGYIRGRERPPGGTGCFEVIAGKSMPEKGVAKVFALVRRVDKKPKRRLRNVQLMQTARGVRSPATGVAKEFNLKKLARVKWFLWHGNVMRADDTLSNLIDEVDGYARRTAKRGGLRNWCSRSYLARWRNLAPTLTIMPERSLTTGSGADVANASRPDLSNLNQLIAKRFVKKQQMRWTPQGAHLLLQVRVHVLNDELGAAFQRWYPKLSSGKRHHWRRSTPRKWMLSYCAVGSGR